MEGDSCPEGGKFESQYCIPDGHFSHTFVLKIVRFVWIDENKQKRGQGWLIKKAFHPISDILIKEQAAVNRRHAA